MSIADKALILKQDFDEVYEAGRTAEQTEFWNSFQNNGTRTWYEHAFFGVWRDEMFNPIYPIIATQATNMFARNNMTKINAPITITGNLSTTVFYGCPTRIISDLTVDETTTLQNWFLNAMSLAHLTIKGVIATSIDLSYSPLTVDSMKSVISRLKNYAGTDYELTYKVSFTSACWAALEASGVSPSGGAWKDYVTDLGWSH